MNMEFFKNICIITRNSNEVYEILSFVQENTNVHWKCGKKPLEFIPENARALFIKKENDNFILLYSTSSYESIYEKYSNQFKIISFKDFNELIKLETIKINVNQNSLDIQIILPEYMKNKLTNKTLNNLKKGLKKSLRKIMNKYKDNPFKLFEAFDKEILKTKKKIISKLEEQKYKELKKSTITKRNVKIDNEFLELLKFVFYKENEYEILLNKLNSDEKILIKQVKLNKHSRNLEITYIDGSKEYKRIKDFIESFFKIEINSYRNLLIKGFFRMENYEFKITDKVCYYYLEDSYEDYYTTPSLGTLENSCMRYSECQDYIKFYEKEGIKLLILKNKNYDYIIGRALVWEDTIDIETNESFKFIDRIYGDDITIALFKRWAYLNGYAHKKEQSYTNKTTFVFKGKKITKKLKYKLKNDINTYKDSGLPYMDTMTYLDDNSNTLYNFYKNDTIELTDTEGNFEEVFNFYICDNCGERVPEDGVCWIGDTPYCEDCYDELVVGTCEECGRPILFDDSYIETITGGYICEHCWDDYVYCDDVDSYVHHLDAHYSKIDGCYYYYKDSMPENNSDNE